MKSLISHNLASSMILNALRQQSPFALLGDSGLESTAGLQDNLDIDDYIENYIQEEYDVPAYSLQTTYQACSGQVAVAEMFNDQDDSWNSFAIPSSVLFAFNQEQVVALKNSLKNNFAVVLGLRSTDDVKAFLKRLYEVDDSVHLVNNITFNDLNANFSVPLTKNEAGEISDYIEWRFDKRIRLQIYTAKYMLPKSFDPENIMVRLFMDLVGRDLAVSCYVSVDIPLIDLINAVNQ